jgi:hypothetical protein
MNLADLDVGQIIKHKDEYSETIFKIEDKPKLHEVQKMSGCYYEYRFPALVLRSTEIETVKSVVDMSFSLWEIESSLELYTKEVDNEDEDLC